MELARRRGLELSLEQGAQLVSLARRVIEAAAAGGRVPDSSDFAELVGGHSEFLKEHRGAFVTLNTMEGDLRGCIGIPHPIKPLGEAVVDAAVGAASHDPRFPRVEAEELDALTVEVSALTPPQALECEAVELPKHVRIGKDGLIVSALGASGLLLPQVATDMRLSPEDFLSLTCRKAGLFPDAWLAPSVKVHRFQAEVFAEAKPRGPVAELKAHA